MYTHTHSSHLRTEVEVLTGKLERVNLAKSMAESKLSEFDRYKTMIELEINETIARHKIAISEKMVRAAQVCVCVCVYVCELLFHACYMYQQFHVLCTYICM